ncbi:hypothetical protein ABN702_05815 [Bacillus haimaensis]|uniref:hypothetical protein n=1 Tax=Bacillus haimaensis TaxID=3160967 RepID=UPI003AA9B8A8
MKKKLFCSLFLVPFILINSTQAFAVEARQPITCGNGICYAYNEIDPEGGLLWFSATTSMWSQPSYTQDRIIATQASFVAKDTVTNSVVAQKNSNYQTKTMATAVSYISNGVKGRLYLNESQHYFYKANGTAFTGNIKHYASY